MSIQRENPGYNRDGYVFCQANGQPYEPRTYQDLFKRCVKRAGIADANFHALRHPYVKLKTKELRIFYKIILAFGPLPVKTA